MVIQEFMDAIRATDLTPPDHIPVGQIFTFAGLNKAKGNRAGRGFVFPDRRGGWFMDYSTGLFQVWHAKRENPYTEVERQAFQEKCNRNRIERELVILEKQRVAAIHAYTYWHRFAFATKSNPYLTKKKIQPQGTKIGVWRVWVEDKYDVIPDSLILPLFDENLNLRSLQAIFPETHPILGRDKDFLAGGQKRGCFWWLGKKSATVLIAEGFATSASLYKATGNQVFIAFDAGNLANVAKIVRAKRPDAKIIIMGDNDHSGTGQAAARFAALACHGKYLIPPIIGQDWNDAINAGVQL